MIDWQFQKMKLAYNEEPEFTYATNAYREKHYFQEYWSPLDEGFRELKQLAWGIATVMPGTGTAEADFLLISRHKDANLSALTDFSL